MPYAPADISVKRSIEQRYFQHYGDTTNCVLCGSLPRQQGSWWDYSPANNHGTITSAPWVRLNSGLWYLDFDGVASTVAIPATAGSIKTFMAWVYIDTKNLSIADFDGGTHSVESDNSATAKITATGWAGPTIRINGAATDVVDVSSWKLITVTTGTAFAASAIVLGQEASFYDGRIAWVYVDKTAVPATFDADVYGNMRHLFGV
jgi:hypothetical protein